MTVKEEDAETLVDVGLTKTEAKVYLTLERLGKANAKTIWKKSGVARQDIYRILNALQMKSIVEKIIAAPTEFRAVPLKEGLSVLLKRKTREYREIEKKTKELLHRVGTNNHEETAAKEYEFTLIATKDANLRRLQWSQINNEKSVDIIDSWNSFKHSIVVHGEPLIEGAKKNVKFRYIIEKPEDGEVMPKIVQAVKKTGCFELRYVSTRPSASLRIEDGKQVSLCVTTTGRTLEAPTLISDNPCLVAILQDYFELLWNNSIEATV